MIRTIAYNVLVARVIPYLEQQLNSISDVLAVQKYASPHSLGKSVEWKQRLCFRHLRQSKRHLSPLAGEIS
jgi:hypothetical protein